MSLCWSCETPIPPGEHCDCGAGESIASRVRRACWWAANASYARMVELERSDVHSTAVADRQRTAFAILSGRA